MGNDDFVSDEIKASADDRKARLHEAKHFPRMLHELCEGIVSPFPAAKRRPRLPIEDILFSMALKTYFRFSGPRLHSLLREMEEKGYLSQVPSPNALCTYYSEELLIPVVEQLVGRSSFPLRLIDRQFAIDSTRILCSGYRIITDWKTGDKKEVHDWVRLHLICGVYTKVIPAASVSNSFGDEKKYLEPLVRSTLDLGFKMEGLAGDKNYSSKKNLRLLTELGITPYLTFKKNSVKSRKEEDATWNDALQKYRSKEDEVMRHYRNRSLVETTNSSLKRKFDGSIMNHKRIAQFNETLFKIVCHNICVWNRFAHRMRLAPSYKTELSR